MTIDTCPQLAHQVGEAKIVSLIPDLCWTPVGTEKRLVPYAITADLEASNANATAQNVRARGEPVFTVASWVSNVQGDEAGTLGGLFSGVHNGYCRPLTPRSGVTANGNFIVAHAAFFFMNCNSPTGQWNTVGKLYYINQVSGDLVDFAAIPGSWWDSGAPSYNGYPKTRISSEFEYGVIAMAEKYHTNPYFLMAIMDRETGGTFNPGIHESGGSGVGLIQFTGDILTDMFVWARALTDDDTGYQHMLALVNDGLADPTYDSSSLQALIEEERANFYNADGSMRHPLCTDPSNDPLCLFRARNQSNPDTTTPLYVALTALLNHEVAQKGAVEQLAYVDLFLSRKLGGAPGSDARTTFAQLVNAVNSNSSIGPYRERLINQINAERAVLGLPSLPGDLSEEELMNLSNLDLIDVTNLTSCTGAYVMGGPGASRQ